MRAQFPNQYGSGPILIDMATKTYVDNSLTLKVSKSGDSMSGPLYLAGDPVTSNQAATKNYVDTAVSNVSSGGGSSYSPPVGSYIIVDQYLTSDPALSAYLSANGQMVSKSTYNALYNVIGTNYNVNYVSCNGMPWAFQYDINFTQKDPDTFVDRSDVALDTGLSEGCCVYVNNKVYYIGGTIYDTDNSYETAVANIYASELDYKGDMYNNLSDTGYILPEPITRAKAYIDNNYIYIVGGQTGDGSNGYTDLNTVYRSNPGYDISSWTLISTIPVGISSPLVVLTISKLYVIYGGTSVMYSADKDPDGNLTNWAAEQDLPFTAEYEHYACVGNYVYFFIGSNVYTYLIDESGIMNYQGYNNCQDLVLKNSQVAVNNNYIYIVGGSGSF